MWKKIIFFILVVLFLLLFQFSFLANFQTLIARLNLLLVALVILVSVVDFSWSLALILAGGLIMDIYSNLPFGLFSLTLLVTGVALEALMLNFFTNRSLYSFIFLGFSATAIYYLTFGALVGLSYLIGLTDFLLTKDFGKIIGFEFLSTALILALFFIIIDNLSTRFKTNFISQ
ncbi:MAG TPA: hypothetical protein PK412_03550 [bacterium]|nr:hypothetical protein [bacterium]